MSERVNPLSADLDHVTDHVGPLWEQLRGARLFITGGTGFVGRWMLESFAWANDSLDLNAHAVVLSRDPARFASRASHLADNGAITMLEGDVCSVELPEGEFTHVLHMATETNTELSARRPSLEFETAVESTRRMAGFAAERGAKAFLYTSSGAIYGRPPADMHRVSEETAIAPLPNDARTAYAQGKRAAEFLCAAQHAETGLPVKIARLFAFVGPFLPMDAGYAVGNFIRDALAGERILIAGDGTPMRSYLYAADLAWWLWTILLAGEAARAYNVGSGSEISILDLARTVSDVLGPTGITVATEPVPGVPPQRYVPDVTRAHDELGLAPTVSLEDGIARTAAWRRALEDDSR